MTRGEKKKKKGGEEEDQERAGCTGWEREVGRSSLGREREKESGLAQREQGVEPEKERMSNSKLARGDKTEEKISKRLN